MMNRPIAALFVIVVVCEVIAAQQNVNPSTESNEATKQGPAAPAKLTFIFKPTFRLQFEQEHSQAREVQSQQTIVIGPPQVVIRDQAL